MKVLIVDDQPLILKSLDHTFSKIGYETIAAIDGMQGREFFDEKQPSLAIVDLMLPFVTGQELIEHIRETESSYTKIIVLSSMNMQHTIQDVFALGADDFIRKPFMPAELISRIKRLEKYTVKN